MRALEYAKAMGWGKGTILLNWRGEKVEIYGLRGCVWVGKPGGGGGVTIGYCATDLAHCTCPTQSEHKIRSDPKGPSPKDAELSRLRAEEEQELRERLTSLLTRTATALKGKPAPLTLHDWSDLPAVGARIVADLANEKAAVERLAKEIGYYRRKETQPPCPPGRIGCSDYTQCCSACWSNWARKGGGHR